jgi:hypothetical protein
MPQVLKHAEPADMLSQVFQLACTRFHRRCTWGRSSMQLGVWPPGLQEGLSQPVLSFPMCPEMCSLPRGIPDIHHAPMICCAQSLLALSIRSEQCPACAHMLGNMYAAVTETYMRELTHRLVCISPLRRCSLAKPGMDMRALRTSTTAPLELDSSVKGYWAGRKCRNQIKFFMWGRCM